MRRILAVLVALGSSSLAACGMLPLGGGAGGGGAYKPAEVMNNAYTGDLSDAKAGQYVTYVSEASGMKTTQTVKIVGKSGSEAWVEQWMDMGSTAYGVLYQIGSDKKVKKAWAAAKGDKEWTSIAVKEPPAAPSGEAPKPKIKESSEKKDVKAGAFDCKRLDVTVNVQGKDYESVTWFSKDVPRIHMGAPEHGGVVASEGSGAKTWLEAKGDDAKPTLELPKS